MTLRLLDYANYGIFLIMGNARFMSSTVVLFLTITITATINIVITITITAIVLLLLLIILIMVSYFLNSNF